MSIEIILTLGVGVIIVGLIGYIWSFAMTPPKCKIAHKEIVDEIKIEFVNHREQMEKFFDLVIENRILKELRKMNGRFQ